MSWRDRLPNTAAANRHRASTLDNGAIGTIGAIGNRTFSAESVSEEMQSHGVAIPGSTTSKDAGRFADTTETADRVQTDEFYGHYATADAEPDDEAQTSCRRENSTVANTAKSANRVETSLCRENYLDANSAESADSSLTDGIDTACCKQAVDSDGLQSKNWQLHRFAAMSVPSGISSAAVQLAEVARQHGAVLVADGLTLGVVEHDPLSPEILAALQTDAGAIIAVLRRETAIRCNWPLVPATAKLWDAEDWRIHFQERAAIREYDGNASREIAERRAWRETANRWWFELGTRFPSNVCAGCGKPVSISDGIPLPYDQRVHDADCVIRFGRRWISEAADALASMGIPAPDGIMPEDAP
jgi:hypothetical protein